MTKQFVKVPTRGITAEELLALWRKGKLYTKADDNNLSAEELLARCQQEAMEYVRAIDEFATDEWRPYIKEVWEAIISDSFFAPHLLMKQKHQMNRYFVTGLVFNLQVLGVYPPVEEVSMLRLHLTLESVSKRNGIFKNWGRYAVTNSMRKRLGSIIQEIRRV